jgi:hypothetical protein
MRIQRPALRAHFVITQPLGLSARVNFEVDTQRTCQACINPLSRAEQIWAEDAALDVL